MCFQQLFQTHNLDRDNFLSRVFGIFNEKIVRCWAHDPHAPYEDLGRPTLQLPILQRQCTLDFTFRSRADGRIYIAEMKCELAYQNYRYLTLEHPAQLDHHAHRPAFQIFLDAAQNPGHYHDNVRVQGGDPLPIHGAILVWGRYTDEGRDRVMAHYGFADVLSLENIVRDLLVWQNQEYMNLICNYQRWCMELFNGLLNLQLYL